MLNEEKFPGLDRRTQNILDELEYQGLEESQTRIHPPNSNIHFSYNRVPWRLRIRKEVFSPSEQISDAATVHLIFCQIVADTFSPLCMRSVIRHWLGKLILITTFEGSLPVRGRG